MSDPRAASHRRELAPKQFKSLRLMEKILHVETPEPGGGPTTSLSRCRPAPPPYPQTSMLTLGVGTGLNMQDFFHSRGGSLRTHVSILKSGVVEGASTWRYAKWTNIEKYMQDYFHQLPPVP